jgi:hypothetical protein
VSYNNTIGSLINFLQAYHPDTPCAWSLWLPSDIIDWCNAQEKRNVSPEQIESILDNFNANADASVGLNWEGLERCIMDEVDAADPLDDLIEHVRSIEISKDHWAYRYFKKAETVPPPPNPENGGAVSE